MSNHDDRDKFIEGKTKDWSPSDVTEPEGEPDGLSEWEDDSSWGDDEEERAFSLDSDDGESDCEKCSRLAFYLGCVCAVAVIEFAIICFLMVGITQRSN